MNQKSLDKGKGIKEKILNKKLGEARQEGYNIGLIDGKAKIYSYKSTTAIKAVKLVDSLVEFLDERYEPRKEDY